jgi:DNA repair photolyase
VIILERIFQNQELLYDILKGKITSCIDIYDDNMQYRMDSFRENKEVITFSFEYWLNFGSALVVDIEKIDISKNTQDVEYQDLLKICKKTKGDNFVINECVRIYWSSLNKEIKNKPNPTKIDWFEDTEESLYTINPIVIKEVNTCKDQSKTTHINCYYQCNYCYFNPTVNRFNHFKTGFFEDRLETLTKIKGNVFIESISDLIKYIIEKILEYNTNNCKILFLTKNPSRYKQFLNLFDNKNMILGVTLETDSYEKQKSNITLAPDPKDRFSSFSELNYSLKFISIEPILRFDSIFIDMIKKINPKFVFIGANSNHSIKLKEPNYKELHDLIDQINKENITIHLKKNLNRIYNNPQSSLF